MQPTELAVQIPYATPDLTDRQMHEKVEALASELSLFHESHMRK